MKTRKIMVILGAVLGAVAALCLVSGFRKGTGRVFGAGGRRGIRAGRV